ncbi:HAMP domain-containing sensor histidine kinase [Saccharibacillus sp. CPCC 101409]|uniref:HAMP domain-containing sensor histidine kinase n=1 Tax=Saccharibacillus sp. CPCC 101409 TaxID=3058041 RepID=UPI00267359DA|nr:HAMP domain-containing sensor histidine kinase [Saccharibacillus sp. CPCC 101409]MDO3411359.1 HAMP domain-containing sensor histidine kinase [Saccharibacillus sp. CPCC 101409]
MKFRESLMARYLMLIGFAIFLLPVLLLLTMAIYVGYSYFFWQPEAPRDRPDRVVRSQLESDWHELAAGLDGEDAAAVEAALAAYRSKHPSVETAYIDAAGRTAFEQPKRGDLPEVWTPSWTAEFMKRATLYTSKTFTVVAFVGEKDDPASDERQGFVVARVPVNLTVASVPDQEARITQVLFVLLFVLLLLLFAFLSWTFFYRIRKRLVRLQTAMTAYDESGMPLPVSPGKRRDEVAALEDTFNEMVEKLRAGRQREREEEELRKRLIANLSHDLRTPLTVVRSHAYSLESEPLGERGRQSLSLMAGKLDDLGGLIDNLLSYTLIAAGRYPMVLEDTDVLRLVRTAAAQWYPVFEKNGMEVDADLPEDALVWRVDREWFVRILDNLFQNAVRHAKTGRYIGLSLGPPDARGRRSLRVRDKGPGLGNSGTAAEEAAAQADKPAAGGGRKSCQASAAGAGIGLSIVDLMIREMGMSWSMESGEGGTVVTIRPFGAERASLPGASEADANGSGRR